jgi:hypothetical protein
LKRAEKYGVVNANVDAMKTALRKFRFESKWVKHTDNSVHVENVSIASIFWFYVVHS